MGKASQRLDDWLVSRAAQRRTQERIDRCGESWSRGAVHQGFDAAMAALPRESAEAVAEAVSALFANESWLDTLIDTLAAALSGDPFFEPPFPALHTELHHGLVIYQDRRVMIAAGATGIGELAARKSARRPATSVGLTGRLAVFKFLKAGDASVSLWEAPPLGPDFSAASAGRCVRVGERRLCDGDLIVMDGRRQSFVVEQAKSSLVLLQAEIMLDQSPVRIEFDSATGQYVGCSANDDGSSRIQMLTTLLRKLDAPQAFAAIADFLEHQDFFVRWHAMRELLGIDLEAALPHLRAMAARDAHAEPRRAARALLDRIERRAA
jgi:hypothetical protein